MNLEVVIGARAQAVGLDDLAELMPDGVFDRPPDLPARFWRWVEDDGKADEGFAGLKAALHHLNTFWTRRADDNVALFHYADLQADLGGEMRRLASILNISPPEEKWPVLVQAATFDRMRDRAEQLAPQVSINGFWHDPSRFFNKGSTGQWQSFFEEGDVDRYENRVREVASADLADWVHHGGRTVRQG
jgi:hypothetical protein